MEYIVYNVMMFGGIYALSKVIEYSVWYFIINHEYYMGVNQ